MAVMDEFKEEREALKNGTPKQKLAYFWYYLQVACDHCPGGDHYDRQFCKTAYRPEGSRFLCRNAECQPLRSDDLGTGPEFLFNGFLQKKEGN